MTPTTESLLKLSSETACFYSIKLGKSIERELRQSCLAQGQIALNFGMTEARHHQLLKLRHDQSAFLKFLATERKRKTSYWENQHRYFYLPEANAVWLTVEKGNLYYAEDLDVLDDSAFSAVSDDGWVTRQVKAWQKVPVPVDKLPGVIRNLGVQRQTIVEIASCRKADRFRLIANVINQERPLVKAYLDRYGDRSDSISALIQQLDPSDFETLVDLILYRMSYTRESVLGEQEKAFDGIYKDLRTDTDTLYVQVKCLANRVELEEFVDNCASLGLDGQTANGLFAFHTSGNIAKNDGSAYPVQVWDVGQIAAHVIRLGLEPWILDRVYA